MSDNLSSSDLSDIDFESSESELDPSESENELELDPSESEGESESESDLGEIELDSDLEIEQDLVDANLKENKKGSIDDKNNALNLKNEKKESKYEKPVGGIKGVKLIKVKESINYPVGSYHVDFFDDLQEEKQYQAGYWRSLPHDKVFVKHFGQRKLFLTELLFLTNYGHLSNTVVYPGAAHGYHIPLLAALFPTHKFYLYDAANFFEGIESYERIKVFNKLFLEEDAMKEEYKNALLISDIRTTEVATFDKALENIASNIKYNEELKQDVLSLLQKEERKEFLSMKLGKLHLPEVKSFLKKNISEEKLKEINLKRELKAVTEQSVINDMNLQASFMEYMRPAKAMLKFRVPYYDDEYCKSQRGSTDECFFPYYKGLLLLQPYAPLSSTEMRLITDSTQTKSYNYNCKEIEYKMFYFNTEIRNKQPEENNVLWDSKQEASIIQNFKIKFPKYTSWNILNYITNIIEKPLDFMSKINIQETLNPEISTISDIDNVEKKIVEEQQQVIEEPRKEIEDLKENFINILTNKNLTRFVLDCIDEMVDNCCLFLNYIIKYREGYWKISAENVKITGYPSIGGTLINYVVSNIMNIEYNKQPVINTIINPILTEYLKQYNLKYDLDSNLYTLIFENKMSQDLKIKLNDIYKLDTDETSQVKYLKDSSYDAINKFIINMINEILYFNGDVISVEDDSSIIESIELYKSKEGSNTFIPKDYKFIEDNDNIIVQSLVWLLCGLNDWLEKDTIDTFDVTTLPLILDKKTNTLLKQTSIDPEELYNTKEKLKIAMFYNNFLISQKALDELTNIFINLQKEVKYNPSSYISSRIRRFSIDI